MTILLVLIPLGVVLLAIALGCFVWAVRNGQFEDLDAEGARILFDEPVVPRRAGSGPEPAPSTLRPGDVG